MAVWCDTCHDRSVAWNYKDTGTGGTPDLGGGYCLDRSIFRQRKRQVRRPTGEGAHEHAENCRLQGPVWPASTYPSSPISTSSQLVIYLSIISYFPFSPQPLLMLVCSTLPVLPTLLLAYSNSPFRSEIKYPFLWQASLAYHTQVASRSNLYLGT